MRNANVLLSLAASISACMQLLSAISSFFLNAWEAASQPSFSFSWIHKMVSGYIYSQYAS